MKTSGDPEQFDDLRRLLALKRHEQPPPGYFVYLPGRVTSRICQGEGKTTFWERVAGMLRFGPSLGYAFCLAACGALTVSIFYSAKAGSMSPESDPTLAAVSWTAAPAKALTADDTLREGQLAALRSIGGTNPVAPAGLATSSLFALPMQGDVLPAVYRAGQ